MVVTLFGRHARSAVPMQTPAFGANLGSARTRRVAQAPWKQTVAVTTDDTSKRMPSYVWPASRRVSAARATCLCALWECEEAIAGTGAAAADSARAQPTSASARRSADMTSPGRPGVGGSVITERDSHVAHR